MRQIGAVLSIGIINQSSPFITANGQESLELAMAVGSFGQPLVLYFVGDGVFQLTKHQYPEEIGVKHYSKGFAALQFYDIDELWVCENSLKARQLTTNDLMIEVSTAKSKQLSSLLARHSRLLSF